MLRTVELERMGAIVPSCDMRQARDAWGDVRVGYGLRPDNGSSLLTLPSAQPKVGKNYRPTASVTLVAGSDGGLCVSDAHCRQTCVVHESMRAQYENVKRARNARTDFLTTHPDLFLGLLLDRLQWAHDRHGILDIRPNANSDVAWERIAPDLFALIATWDGRAYDYTKRIDRVGFLAENYRTTFSVTRFTRPDTVQRITGRGDTVTAVFPSVAPLPATWRGLPVVDGDVTDDRFSDPAGSVVGLLGKGKLRGVVEHPLLVRA
jgi:hypothetical protein